MTNILLIVEGAEDEYKFYNQISKLTSGNQTNFNFFIYKTNIYELYKDLESYEFDVDIEEVLRNNKQNTEKEKECLNNKYAYKYLIFDFEFQDKNFPNKPIMLDKLINYFSDETENGKLYINYPMMESYRDMKFIGDDDYKDQNIETSDLSKYKYIVGKRGNSLDIKKYSWEYFKILSSMNIKKANLLINNRYDLLVYDNYLKNLTQSIILKNQLDLLNNDYMFVINCGTFLLVDYFGSNYFKNLK